MRTLFQNNIVDQNTVESNEIKKEPGLNIAEKLVIPFDSTWKGVFDIILLFASI